MSETSHVTLPAELTDGDALIEAVRWDCMEGPPGGPPLIECNETKLRMAFVELGKRLSDGDAGRDTLRLRWLAETVAAANDNSEWAEMLRTLTAKRFNEFRKDGTPNLDALRKAIDTQVVHESATSHSSLPARCVHGVTVTEDITCKDCQQRSAPNQDTGQ